MDAVCTEPRKNSRIEHVVQRAESIQRCHLTSIGNPIVELRRSYDRLISTMGFPILVTQHLYSESGPWCPLPGLLSWYPISSLIQAMHVVGQWETNLCTPLGSFICCWHLERVFYCLEALQGCANKHSDFWTCKKDTFCQDGSETKGCYQNLPSSGAQWYVHNESVRQENGKSQLFVMKWARFCSLFATFCPILRRFN